MSGKMITNVVVLYMSKSERRSCEVTQQSRNAECWNFVMVCGNENTGLTPGGMSVICIHSNGHVHI